MGIMFAIDLELQQIQGRVTISQDSDAPQGFGNSTKLACTTADTSIASSELFIFQQRIEGQNVQQFAKELLEQKPITVSFYVKETRRLHIRLS